MPEEEQGSEFKGLFKVDNKKWFDAGDLTKVNRNKDIIDADEDGSLDSLTAVSDEDVMGSDEFDEELFGEAPLKDKDKQPKPVVPVVYRPKPYAPPAQISKIGE